MDGEEGWFPRLAIKEAGDEEFDYATLSRSTSRAASSSQPVPVPPVTTTESTINAFESPVPK